MQDEEPEQTEEEHEMEALENEDESNKEAKEEVCCNGRKGDMYCRVSCKVVANDVYDSKWCDLV